MAWSGTYFPLKTPVFLLEGGLTPSSEAGPSAISADTGPPEIVPEGKKQRQIHNIEGLDMGRFRTNFTTFAL